MFTYIKSLISGPTPPPPTNIIGIRIPANNTPAHLVALTTTSASGATDDFLVHIPDVRRFWAPENAWQMRDLYSLDLRDASQAEAQLQRQRQRQPLKWDPHANLTLLQRQRKKFVASQQYYALSPYQEACVGRYYVFWSFALDDLPQNLAVPKWMVEEPQHSYWGDVFLVKVRDGEGEGGDGVRAVYEDVDPGFLEVLRDGPLGG
ncbi:hypothetical protein B0J11DRAFT_283162 [Dendryphion nanum]|uniref:Uncharacterized protein n=1 Tax=Dendryphion nanum TaxID=256645 RepID=A0A9P9IN50_9PLEO|nr:hypothetical protein B0J11DRAFT_283162 [Dendryphion nanum]